MTSLPYRDFAAFLSERFDHKVQKITVNAGFSCPNRDGSKGRGGCSYCNNRSFSPAFAEGAVNIEEQLEKGKQFFARKYPEMRYLAYFQAYTNTHSNNKEALLRLYERALAVDDVEGLIIGTRPDCVDSDLLKRIASLRSDGNLIMMEYGAETSHDATLEAVNRCHTWQDTVNAVNLTARSGLTVGIHLIMGLPGETEDMMLETIRRVNTLPVDVVKIHQLQVIKGTLLGRQWENGEITLPVFTPESYAELCCKIVRTLRKDIAIERFVSSSPAELLIAPRWGLKNYEFTAIVNRKLRESEER